MNWIALSECIVDLAQEAIKAAFTYLNGKHYLETTDAGKHCLVSTPCEKEAF